MPARPMPYARTRGPLAYMAIDSATGDMDEMETPPPTTPSAPPTPNPQPETAVNRGRVRNAPTPGTLARTHALRSSLERPYPRNSGP